MPFMNMVQAINAALREEMLRDRRVVVLGEDVGVNGGVFRVTDGLLKEFGPERVMDTPLDEGGIIGFAIGMALYGLKPVAEIQFAGFFPDAFEQITTSLAKMRWATGGQFAAPVVIRVPSGGGIRGGPWHSQSPEAYFTHTAGLKVVAPSGPYEAKGLLISAVRDEDPVIFLEFKRLYRAFREEVPEEEYTVPLGKARIAREGKDVSVFAYGAMLRASLEAAEQAASQGISVEVVDLRTLLPLDTETILKSVAKTGRAVIVHEAPKTSGFGAEVAAVIAERALAGPIVRVAGLDAPVHFSIGDEYLPDPSRIFHAIVSAMRDNRKIVAASPTSRDAQTLQPQPASASAMSTPVVSGREELIPFRGLRRRIAEKMVRAKHMVPHVTHIDQVDMTELVALRVQLKQNLELKGMKLTYLPFIIKAVILALKQYPIFNATLDEERGAIVLKKYYNIGIATAADEGLIVPVIKNADQKSILELAAEIERLAQKVRDRKISLEELQNGTFTITNVGSIGGLASTPIINYPEVAILGIHKIHKQPVVKDGQITIRDVAYLTLSFDHRVADGAAGAAFMNELITYLETPHHLLMGLI